MQYWEAEIQIFAFKSGNFSVSDLLLEVQILYGWCFPVQSGIILSCCLRNSSIKYNYINCFLNKLLKKKKNKPLFIWNKITWFFFSKVQKNSNWTLLLTTSSKRYREEFVYHISFGGRWMVILDDLRGHFQS